MSDEYGQSFNDYDEIEDDYYQTEPPEKVEMPVKVTNFTIQVGKKEGKIIKNLIRDCYDGSFPEYCKKVGIAHPNFYATLKGDRPCTLEFLNKMLSGIGYRVEFFNPVLHILAEQTGRIVPDVDSIIQEEELQSSARIDLIGDQGSSLLEKHLENLKTRQEPLSSESQVESSSSTSNSAEEAFLTLSPMRSDVDL